jgi:hypothetical protein
MVLIQKIIGVMCCGVLLGLGLPAATMAENNSATQGSGAKDEKVRTIKGEVFHVTPDNYLVKEPDGKLVRLHIDATTQMTGRVGLGERIEAKVNEESHALAIRQAQ